MTATEAMGKIDSLRFSALANLASDFRTLLRILADQVEVRVLSEAMKSAGVTQEVFSRVHAQVQLPAEAGYEHPADVALAVYLWLLAARGRRFAESAAEAVAKCSACWWSSKMVAHRCGDSGFTPGAIPTVSAELLPMIGEDAK